MADPVVTTLATGSSATATTTVSFAAQTAGTLLELKVGSDDYRVTTGSNRPESTGWALATSGQDFLGAYVWYKIASGSETSVQYTIGSAAASQYELITYTNIDTTSPLGAVSSLHTHGGASTGTTAITPGAGSRWIVSAFLAGMHSGASSLGPAAALSNSYTIQSTVTGTGSPTEVGMSGYLVLDGGTATSTATVAPGWTVNSPSCSFGLLVAYKVAAGGGGVTGTMATTLDDSVLAASAAETIPGTFATTLADSTLAATATETFSGTLAATLDDATLTAAAVESMAGTLATTLDNAVLAAVGAETFTGTLAVTLGDAVLAATGTSVSGVTGTFATTLGDAVLSATGSEILSGTFATSLDGAVLTAAGTVVMNVTGTLVTVLDDAQVTAVGTETFAGTLTVSLAGAVLAAVGTVTDLGPYVPLVDAAHTRAVNARNSPRVVEARDHARLVPARPHVRSVT